MAKNPEINTVEKETISKKPRGRPSSDAIVFPRDPLSKVLKIAESIEKNNAGKPYDRLDLAKSIDSSPTSSTFRQLITSSSRYGITEGSYAAEKISLTVLGSSIVAPTSDEQNKNGLRQALLESEVFKNVYNHFDRKQIPREELFKNTLKKEFNVLPEDVDICYDVIMQNMKDFGLIQDIKGNTYLQLDKLGSAQTQTQLETSEQNIREEIKETDQEIPSIPRSMEEKQIPKQIFVAHGKNTKPLEQLKEILDQFKVPYKVAIDEANAGRPVSKKVSDLMRECSSAIFIFTKDEETKTLDGNTVYRPSDNVVFELGAASVLYENKIVIFKENGVSFGSDFKDLGYISFDTDQLGAKTVELMKELIGFGLLKISAT